MGRPTGTKLLALGALVTAVTGAYAIAVSPRSALPNTVDVDAVIASDEQSGLLEGCVSVYYRLSASTLTRLNKEGIAFLTAGPPPRAEDSRNPFGAWTETPGAINLKTNGRVVGGTTIYGLYGISGCGRYDEVLRAESIELAAALAKPGSYYTVTANREGIIVVAPQLGRAAYFYFG